MDAFGTVMIGIMSIPLLAAWRGYVLSILWGWFFVPLGAPVIGVAMAIGISMTAGYITKEHTKQSREDEDASVLELIAIGAATPAIVLLFGWIVVQFA